MATMTKYLKGQKIENGDSFTITHPCPWCGCLPEFHVGERSFAIPVYALNCPKRGCPMFEVSTLHYDDPEETMQVWNNGAKPKPTSIFDVAMPVFNIK